MDINTDNSTRVTRLRLLGPREPDRKRKEPDTSPPASPPAKSSRMSSTDNHSSLGATSQGSWPAAISQFSWNSTFSAHTPQQTATDNMDLIANGTRERLDHQLGKLEEAVKQVQCLAVESARLVIDDKYPQLENSSLSASNADNTQDEDRPQPTTAERSNRAFSSIRNGTDDIAHLLEESQREVQSLRGENEDLRKENNTLISEKLDFAVEIASLKQQLKVGIEKLESLERRDQELSEANDEIYDLKEVLKKSGEIANVSVIKDRKRYIELTQKCYRVVRECKRKATSKTLVRNDVFRLAVIHRDIYEIEREVDPKQRLLFRSGLDIADIVRDVINDHTEFRSIVLAGDAFTSITVTDPDYEHGSVEDLRIMIVLFSFKRYCLSRGGRNH